MKKIFSCALPAVVLLLAAGLFLAGCKTEDEAIAKVVASYTSESGGTTYVLTLKDDGTYTLTAGGKTSTGTYTRDNSTGPVTLTSSKGDTVNVTINSSGKMANLGGGSITFDDGSSVALPVEVTPQEPANNTPPQKLTITDIASWKSALNAVKNGSNNAVYEFTINGTVGVPGSTDNTPTFGYKSGITVTLLGNGTLYLNDKLTANNNGVTVPGGAGRGSIFYLNGSQTLIIGVKGDNANAPNLVGLQDAIPAESLSATPGYNKRDNDASVIVYNGSSDVSSSGKLIMANGTISRNTTSASGGGVGISNGGTFNMSGGTISGNTTSATSATGGGVYIYNGSTFNMSGGTISANTANDSIILGNDNLGGGVSIYKGTFDMSGGTISGNFAGSSGGGVLSGESRFTMSGGTISANTAYNWSGGGLYLWGGPFDMGGNAIISNNSSFIGGGVGVADGGAFTMSGGTISGNSVSRWNNNESGGGVHISGISSTFIKKGNSVIYGYGSNTPADDRWNKVIRDDTVTDTYGHAVYYEKDKDNDCYYRDTTLTVADNISTASSTLPTTAGPANAAGNWIKK